MHVSLSASGTPAQIINTIGHDITRERAANPDDAHVLYAVRDRISRVMAEADPEATFTIAAELTVTITETAGERAGERTGPAIERFPDGFSTDDTRAQQAHNAHGAGSSAGTGTSSMRPSAAR